ncbi:MAG: YajQ family cyclic di-GMP-binding protein [Gammaproteobacteria bacterium]|nr:YajQ family cyclic di-GMP-binding protein [Gammaproteobacteria bacterium]HBW84735.1 YajQ family cyclic di-GMP-binding protein [Gammaproteobacteria bacterium]|tara:strand:+ start:512 stop:997 length:486 start_codon:yes stop_codon:yes gene_type:complete
MPSFDIVSEVDMQEVRNAVDQSNREIGTRFDFKGVEALYELTASSEILLSAEVDFQNRQMLDILKAKLVKRGIDIKALKEGGVESSGQKSVMRVLVQQGIASDLARKLVKMIKETKIKVQAAIQGEKLRVSGKKRDDLQGVIAMLKEASLDIPLQYNNFRD